MHEALLPNRTFEAEPGDFVLICRHPVGEFTEWLEFSVKRSENSY